MIQSHFDKLIETEIAACAKGALKVNAADPTALAKLQGQAAGLERARQLYREAIRTDIEADEAA